jgi:uncharacterized protein (DUF1697 family)
LRNVQTVIASGNVIFEANSQKAAAIENKLARRLEESLGFEVATYVRSMEDLAKIASYVPFPPEPEGGALYIAFLPGIPSRAAREKLISVATATDKFRFHGRELYWLCLTRFSDSRFSGARLERILGVPVTVRSAVTVRKIAAKCQLG